MTIGPYSTYLVGIIGVSTLSAGATATASIIGINAPSTIQTLGSATCPGLSVTHGASMQVAYGSIQVDSSCTTGSGALDANHGGSIQATHGVISVVGSSNLTNGGSVSPALITGGAPLGDPFASIPIPNITGLGADQGSQNCNGGHSLVLNPGVYSSVSASNGCTLRMMPGNYIIGNLSMDGDAIVTIGSSASNTTIVLKNGMSISHGATVTGTNVLFYNACLEYSSRLPSGCSSGDSFGGITFSLGGLGSITPQSSGPYQNLTIFQDRNNPQTMTLSNGATLNAGTIYGKSMPVNIARGATVPAQLVVDSVILGEGATVNVTMTQTQEFQGANGVGMTQ